jgi:tetraacyldisaccharide 4'-kinase
MIHLPPDPVSPTPMGLGMLLSPAYGLVVARRNAKYDKNRGVFKPTLPVISVGNISVGGTGKTPLVKRVVYTLKLAGYRPGIVLRGYGPKINGVSDEEAEHRLSNPATTVVANPNRVRAISDLITRQSGPRVNSVVLDDGFQHRRVARQVDIVLIDAARDPFKDHLLPWGWLREPVHSLKRATAVVITHAESTSPSAVKTLANKIEAVHGKQPIAVTSHGWTDLTLHNKGTDATEPVEWLEGKRLLACCAIARPRPFLSQLRAHGATLVDAMILKDHAPINRSKSEQLARRAKSQRVDAIVCTDKDWVKMKHLPESIWPVPVVCPTLEHVFVSGLKEFDAHIIEQIGGKH